VSPATIGIVVFVCTFGGVLAGMRLGRAIPEEHLKGESKESIRTGIGLIATMTALVLGLVTASAKQSFDDVERRCATSRPTCSRSMACWRVTDPRPPRSGRT
jgi:hypothetical protein